MRLVDDFNILSEEALATWFNASGEYVCFHAPNKITLDGSFNLSYLLDFIHSFDDVGKGE